MKKMTEKNLWDAFAGESQAHMKYRNFAEKAEAENYPNLARVFRANAFAEVKHASNHFRHLGGIGSSADNVKAAIEGETFEIEQLHLVIGPSMGGMVAIRRKRRWFVSRVRTKFRRLLSNSPNSGSLTRSFVSVP